MNEKGEFKKPEKTISSKEYWENYFNLHPEIRPSKIIYGDFYTSTYEEDKDLEKWAESKNVWRQDEDKKERRRTVDSDVEQFGKCDFFGN